MLVHLADLHLGLAPSAVAEFADLAAAGGGRHQLVDDPAQADIILFVEWHQLGDPISPMTVYRSDLVRSFRDKCYSFDQRPRSYCSLPGLYTSVPWRHLRRRFQVPWTYHRVEAPQQVVGDDDAHLTPPDLLFSFLGSTNSHPSRPPLVQLSHPDALVEQVEGHLNWDATGEGFRDRRVAFAESVLRSKFVLCPRGRATSSFRFYEVMAAGRVPVVIADDWVPPAGINLEEFAIWWPEGVVDGLVEHLEQLAPNAATMGARAREVYLDRFTPEVIWDSSCDQLERLHATSPHSQFPRLGFQPDHRVVRHAAGKVVKQARGLRVFANNDR